MASFYQILFQNRDFIYVNKPAMVLSVPPRFPEKDQRDVLGKDLEKQLGVSIFPVHRLDFEVSGIIVYALNRAAHQHANIQFENKLVVKRYQAITETTSVTVNESLQLEWKAKILKGKKRTFESPHGQSSLTRAICLRKVEEGYLWILQPVTGRSHQLRWEMYRNGHPIIGDQLYGSKLNWSEGGIALKSFSLTWQNKEFYNKFELPENFEIPGWK